MDPEYISKSYTASLKEKAEEDAAEINTPIEPEVGGCNPFDPLKFKPVPSVSREEDNVAITSLDPAVGLICILPL